jgi:hypothetical protein
VLFHVTLTHEPRDCPGRRPGEPPELVAPSDKRVQLARDLGVTSHFVLWGASCILWAQPEHVTYALLEADDLESVLQYVTATTPREWRCTAVPVWNLPTQLRLVRNVLTAASGVEPRLAPETDRAGPPAEPPHGPPTQTVQSTSASSDITPLTELAGSEGRSGTITQLLEAVNAATEPGALPGPSESPAGDSASGGGDEVPTLIPGPGDAASRRVRLRCVAGPAEGTTFEVNQARATLGRLPSNTIYIPDARLSRTHASIELRDDGWWLTDLGSLNGTAVNGALVQGSRSLQTGDTIELGATHLSVDIEGDAAS